MVSSQEPTARFPTVAVVIPKMEQPPSVRSPELKKAKQAAVMESVSVGPAMPSASVPSTLSPEEKKASLPQEPEMPHEISEEEVELVSSLAKLQKMEAMVGFPESAFICYQGIRRLAHQNQIHQLRTLLPERLLEPLAPIVNPRAAPGKSVPASPRKIFEQLSQAARGGVAEVAEFQSMWRSPEMKPVWDRVDTQIKENGGRLLQPTGMWEHDYDVLLEGMTKHEKTVKDQQQSAQEELECSRLQSTEGGWKALVEIFAQKNIPGVRILPTTNDFSFIVFLGKAGLAFKVYYYNAASATQGNGLPDWNVSSKTTSTQPTSKLETAVLDCLNSRPRKWDLPYLLDMISTYANMKQTPCIKCGKMTDNAANLPTLRRPKSPQPSDGSLSQQITWEAYHPTCV
ncbi:hypothetical protein AOCH_000760 [Aspergillus ochraceoroseus]|uniref:Mediator complex subunit 27 n=1 Tax=Aspergillus ochraceoroseus TaxID=138278 RepID=A0A0F8V6D3_9EURO|nr:hypothetical protein AOCH_000760 [Aspergillus ochraceoroseus]